MAPSLRELSRRPAAVTEGVSRRRDEHCSSAENLPCARGGVCCRSHTRQQTEGLSPVLPVGPAAPAQSLLLEEKVASSVSRKADDG